MRKSLIMFLLVAFGVSRGIGEEAKDIAFKSTYDGTEQRYMAIMPDGFEPNKPVDLLIGLHGHGSDRKQFATDQRDECKAFRDTAKKYNMIAVTPDYRAKTSWMGPAAEADMVQLIEDLKKKYKIRHVFITGGSMGGTSSLTFAAMHPELVDGVVALNPHANHIEYENFQDAILTSFGGSKTEVPMEYKKRSAEFWPERLTMPVAITVGGKDTSVPPQSATRLYHLLRKLGNQDTLLIERPHTGHSTSYADSVQAFEFVVEKVIQ